LTQKAEKYPNFPHATYSSLSDSSININLVISTLLLSCIFCVILYRNTQGALKNPISVVVANVVQFEPFKEEEYPFHIRTRCVPRIKQCPPRV